MSLLNIWGHSVSDRSLRRAMFFGLGGGFLAAISRLNIVDLDLFHEMALIREAFRVGFYRVPILFHMFQPSALSSTTNGARA